MDIRRLVVLSFGIKIFIIIFFVILLLMHYLICQALSDPTLFSRTVSIATLRTKLEAGADVNIRTTGYSYSELNGLTPLMRAATWGDLKRVKLLLEYDADVNLKAESKPGDLENRQGDTALHMAIRSATYGTFSDVRKIINLLLNAGADVNAKNNYGDTPLHATLDVSQIRRRKFIADLLIKGGADINAQNRNGNTQLHLAVQRGFGPWIEWFMKKYGGKVDLSIENNDGYTVQRLAERLKNTPVLEALERGVKVVEKAYAKNKRQH